MAMQAYYKEDETPRMLKKHVSDARMLTAAPSKRMRSIEEDGKALTTVTVNAGRFRRQSQSAREKVCERTKYVIDILADGVV
jgi:hypothetical protein